MELTETISELRALLAKATPGPWRCDLADEVTWDIPDWPEYWISAPDFDRPERDTFSSIVVCRAGCEEVQGHQREDARLIAAAINALPALLDAAEENRELRERLSGKTMHDAAAVEREAILALLDEEIATWGGGGNATALLRAMQDRIRARTGG